MPIMDTVMGGVGTGVQPKDNPSPTTPPASASAETFNNSIPPPAQAPQAAQQPAPAQQPQPAQAAQPAQAPAPAQQPDQPSKEDSEVDDLISQLAGKQKSAPVQKKLNQDSDETDRLINQLSGRVESDTAAPGGGAVQSKGFESLPESARFMAAQMRAHLGRNPVEQRAAFESMYGGENVKTSSGALYFRPDKDQKFRKVDEKLFGGISDAIIFNLLNAGPLAANMATQAGVDATTKSVVAGGAAGGAVDALTRQTMISGLNSISALPQDKADLKTEILKDAGLNAVLPLGLKYAAKMPIAKQAITALSAKMADSLAAKELTKAGEEVGKLAQVRVAFNEFKNSIFPQAAESPEKTGAVIGNAVDKVHETLSKSVGAIKNEALALAEQKGQNVQMNASSTKIASILQDHGYFIDDLGMAKPFASVDQSLIGEGRLGAVDKLADYYNRIAGEANGQAGTPLKQVFSDIDNLSKLSAFDKSTPVNADVRSLYRQVRNAAAQDRNAAINDLYQGSGLPNEKIWKDSFDKYSGNIDAISDFQSMFHSPQERELLVNTLSKSSTPQKNEMLDGMKQVLGSESKEWNAFRGEVFSNLLERHTQNGVVDASGMAKFLTAPGNQPFITRVFSNEEKGVMNKMLMETQRINRGAGLDERGKGIVKAGMELLSHMGGKPIQVVKTMMGVLENNKEVVDYLVDDGFLEMAQTAEGPEAKRRILDAMRYADNLRSKMKIIDVPTTAEKTKAAALRRYAPIAGPALSAMIHQKLNPVSPGSAPIPVPAPASNQTPGMNTNQ